MAAASADPAASPAPCAPPEGAEQRRLQRLASYRIVDTVQEQSFDSIVRLASALLQAPIAIINFVGADRQWFKAEVGIGCRELPLDDSICRFAILQPGLFVVPDLTRDARFDGNPLVHAADGLRFYAGALLQTSDGLPLGTVCVLDRTPRPEGLTDWQRDGLLALAEQTMALLDRHLAGQHLQFLMAVRDDLQAPHAPAALTAGATTALADFLGIAQVGLAELDGAGSHLRLDGYGPDVAARLRSGATVAISNIAGSNTAVDAQKTAFSITPAFTLPAAGALCHVPLLRDGRLVALLFCHHPEPRDWPPADIRVIEEVAQAMWIARERRRAEQMAIARADELSALVDSAPVGIAYFDADHRYIRINDELAASNGFSIDAHLGQSIAAIIPDLAGAVGAVIDRVFATGETLRQVGFTGQTAAAEETRHWLASFFPVRDTAGTIRSVGTWVLDMTENERAREALSASETLLRQAQDLGGVGSWQWNHSLDIGHVSASYCRLHGLPEDRRSLSSGDVLAAMLPEERDGFRHQIAAGLAHSDRIVIDYRVRLPDGRLRYLRGVGQTIAGPTPGRWSSGVIADVTEERENEAELARSEAAFRSVFEQAAVGIALVKPDGCFIRVNDRFRAITGLTEAMLDSYQQITHPDDIAADEALAARTLAGEIDSYTMEKRYLRATGDAVWVTLAVRLIRDANGAPAYFVSVIEDISRRKAAEAELSRISAELEIRVTERTADLAAEIERRERLQAQLVQSQKLEALGQMTAGLAHDFNNVLAAVAGGYDLIQRWSDNPRVNKVAAQGSAAAQRGGNLVRQLLAFARQQRLEIRPIDLASLIAEVRPLLERAAPGAQLIVDVPADIGWVASDASGLEAALINFAVNARDAMPGGGTLTISARACPHTAADHPPELDAIDAVRVAVTDTGNGMAPDVLTRVMEPFFTTKGVGKGTGLGLATANGFASQSGGAMRIDSQPGAGTTVALYLPVARPTADTACNAQTAADLAPTRRHLLLVDDDPLVRAMTADQLRDIGHTVTEADGPASALALAGSIDQFDALVSDVVMPGVDGIALASRLRERRPDLPVLFMTGHADRARLAGHLVIDKPFTREQLLTAIAALLD